VRPDVHPVPDARGGDSGDGRSVAADRREVERRHFRRVVASQRSRRTRVPRDLRRPVVADRAIVGRIDRAALTSTETRWPGDLRV